ncbi:MAG TPA: Hpt domain-containing protein [Burkholderiaceae bacterium]|nr:Hpt domain-containing protein [Burkholderiaceae bacterium]
MTPLYSSPRPNAPCGPAESGASTAGGLGVVLDAQALARLRELDPSGTGSLMQRVLDAYVASLDKGLVQWERARAAGDRAMLRSVAHTLKSSSASVGALGLSALCAEVEKALRDGREDGLDDRLDALAVEAARVLGALRPMPEAAP